MEETPVLMTLGELKRHFDAESTYLVFESIGNPATSIEFEGAISVCRRFGEKNTQSQIYYDQARNRFLLIVRVDPKDKESVMREILEAGLPKDVVFSVYGSRL